MPAAFARRTFAVARGLGQHDKPRIVQGGHNHGDAARLRRLGGGTRRGGVRAFAASQETQGDEAGAGQRPQKARGYHRGEVCREWRGPQAEVAETVHTRNGKVTHIIAGSLPSFWILIPAN